MIRVVISAIVFAFPAFSEPVSEPQDYRTDNYRAAVPETLSGVTVIGSETAFALWKTDRVAFVDVWPRPPKPAKLPEGTIWRDPKRYSIPGSIWLPNVGYGELAEITEDYFQRGLAFATNDDFSKPVVLFCLEECWMSWNAAKRALEYGYTHVYWFPDGTDGWEFNDYPVEEVIAFPEP